MKTVGKFEKVSLNEFKKSIKEEFEAINGDRDIELIYENIQLPKRSTTLSAGYDFFAPFDFELKPNEVIKIPTGIRVKIDDGWFLSCMPRSGLGFKYYETLANTIGIIDADYYNSANEGHIMAKIVNRNPFVCNSLDTKLFPRNIEKDTMKIKRGQGFMQGIFFPFGITYDDTAVGIRNGGFGSTDKVN